MAVYERLMDIIARFGIYNVDNTFLKGELSAYAAGIQTTKNLLLEMERECFVVSAQDYGILEKESLFGSFRTDNSVVNRRKMLLSALAVDETAFTLKGMNNFLDSFPTGHKIIEKYSENALTIVLDRNGWAVENMDYIETVIANFFPAHLEITINVLGIMWDEIESRKLTFGEMDGKGYTWDALEAVTG